jgi:hypothetical protein
MSYDFVIQSDDHYSKSTDIKTQACLLSFQAIRMGEAAFFEYDVPQLNLHAQISLEFYDLSDVDNPEILLADDRVNSIHLCIP